MSACMAKCPVHWSWKYAGKKHYANRCLLCQILNIHVTIKNNKTTTKKQRCMATFLQHWIGLPESLHWPHTKQVQGHGPKCWQFTKNKARQLKRKAAANIVCKHSVRFKLTDKRRGFTPFWRMATHCSLNWPSALVNSPLEVVPFSGSLVSTFSCEFAKAKAKREAKQTCQTYWPHRLATPLLCISNSVFNKHCSYLQMVV